MSSRHQAKLITIYRILGFSFFISFRFQCNTCFQYAISYFAKAYCNNFASNFWQVAVCGIYMSKSFTGYHILLLELISFQNLQPPKHRQRHIVNYVMRIQRLHKLQYHRRFLVLFSMLYPLFNKIQRKLQWNGLRAHTFLASLHFSAEELLLYPGVGVSVSVRVGVGVHKMLGQMLKSWNFSLYVFFLAFYLCLSY